MSESDRKPKHKPIKHNPSLNTGWPESTHYFEFVAPYELNACVLMIWEYKRAINKGRIMTFENVTVDVQQPLLDIAHFTIKIAAQAPGRKGQLKTIYQGTLEGLNDGATVVRGNTISPSLLWWSIAIFLGITTLMAFVVQTILFLLPGLLMAGCALGLFIHQRQANFQRIKSIFGAN